MPKSLSQIQAAIEKLQSQADALKKKESNGVVARIKEAIAHYGLTAADLGLASPSARAPKAGKAKVAKAVKRKAGSRSKGVVKYKDDAGNTWTGHGRRPQWFIDAIGAGKSEADLRA